MDGWTLIEKLGEFAVGCFALIGGICLIVAGFGDWIQAKFGEMKNWPKWLRCFIGIIIVAFCSLWFAAIIKVELKRREEGSPVYQAQEVVKHHLHIICEALKDREYKLTKNPNDEIFTKDFQDGFFRFKLGGALSEANKEGLDTTEAEKYEEMNMVGMNATNRAAFYHAALKEVQKLEDQLPRK